MNPSNQPSIRKKWRVVAIVVNIVAFLALGLWLLWLVWMFGSAEKFAGCDGGFAIWRRDPGAWSSYVYEIRDGASLVETGLSFNQIRNFMDEHSCVILISG